MNCFSFGLLCLCLTLAACNGNPTGSTSGAGSKDDNINGIKGSIEEWQSLTMGQEGHGGDAIVCFSIPVGRALEKIDLNHDNECQPTADKPCPIERVVDQHPRPKAIWRMTSEGRRSILSAKPLEQYLAERIESKKAFIKDLNKMSVEEGYQLILTPFLKLPGASFQISEIHQKLGWLSEDGISSEYGLRDINDSGFINENEIDRVHCKELQAVVRRDDQLWYDADIVRHFDVAGMVLMQLHEEIYAWGKSLDKINKEILYGPSHETSEKTRRLILKIVDSNLDHGLVNKNLKSLGFSVMHWANLFNTPTSPGDYMDTDTCRSEQKDLRDLVFNTGEGRDQDDLRLAMDRLFSNRYLKARAEFRLELRFNFPPTLADMMAYVHSRGSRDTYQQDLELLLQNFERPESCLRTFH